MGWCVCALRKKEDVWVGVSFLFVYCNLLKIKHPFLCLIDFIVLCYLVVVFEILL